VFAEKVEDVVGLYMDLPRHAAAVAIDEKSQRPDRVWNRIPEAIRDQIVELTAWLRAQGKGYQSRINAREMLSAIGAA
jgi:uncharacterized protein (DUF4415 family)